jgi:radical SAM protein (TIGR04043 family)
MALRNIIVELQSYGLKIEPFDKGRKGGAGPSDGRIIVIEGSYFFVPTMNKRIEKSPYSIKGENGKIILTKNGKDLIPISFQDTPKFYAFKTPDNIPFPKIALLHGSDCLATTVFQKCIRWNPKDRCKFCGIELSLLNDNTIPIKRPDQLAMVAETAKDLDNINHITLTTGTINREDKGTLYLGKCASSIKKKVELPIHAQFEPPNDLEILKYLRDMGVDSIGIHLESFDEKVRKNITPGKAEIPISRYFETFEKGIEIFGRNQVSSFIIVGLGESPESIIDGSKKLIDMGVYPFILPLRPLLNSLMEREEIPDPYIMMEIYGEIGKYMNGRLNSKRSKAGCVRCRACSPLPLYEDSL